MENYIKLSTLMILFSAQNLFIIIIFMIIMRKNSIKKKLK